MVIGAGNLATNLAIAFNERGINISQVFSRTFENANVLAKKVGAEAISNFDLIKKGNFLYIISLTDDALLQAVSQLIFNEGIVVHTSGSVSINVLKRVAKNHGVFYPLQTFSKEYQVDFFNIPIGIESSDNETKEYLFQLAGILSGDVIEMTSEQRRNVHLAAVFACNFSNLMYSIAENILRKNNLPFEILHTLIQETASKAVRQSPAEIQTGPARRNDKVVIDKHLEMLQSDPESKEIYRLLSDAIHRRYFS